MNELVVVNTFLHILARASLVPEAFFNRSIFH